MTHERVLEGVLRRSGMHVGLDIAPSPIEFNDYATDLWLELLGCRARVHVLQNWIGRVEILDPSCAFHEVGPVDQIEGVYAIETGAPGTKMAGSTQVFFDAGGVRYGVYNPRYTVAAAGRPIVVEARKLVPNMAYAARSTDVELWILGPYLGD